MNTKKGKKVLVVDDEKLIRWSLEHQLSSWEYNVDTAENVAETYNKLKENLPDLVLLDIKLPDGNGIEILERIKNISDDIAVIMITAEGTVETAVQAMKLGAYDYISKPFNMAELQQLIQKALDAAEMKKSLDYYRADKIVDLTRDQLIGESEEFSKVQEIISKVAASPVDIILILGESGTGKNVVARTIHNYSERADRPFVTIECTTIPENLLESELFGHEKGSFTNAHATKKGLFELANSGTAFIDEIGDLPLSMQAKLLRVVDEKRFKRVGGVTEMDIDVRIIAATNMNLERAVTEKKFRRDLYYRLNIVPICLPPLRNRGNDILILANLFLKKYVQQFGKDFKSINSKARDILLDYSWPGNVRELRNAIERAVLLENGEEIMADHLMLKQAYFGPPEKEDEEIDISPNNTLTIDEVEIKMITNALKQSRGNQTRAARILGISRDVLRYRIKKYNIEKAV